MGSDMIAASMKLFTIFNCSAISPQRFLENLLPSCLQHGATEAILFAVSSPRKTEGGEGHLTGLVCVCGHPWSDWCGQTLTPRYFSESARRSRQAGVWRSRLAGVLNEACRTAFGSYPLFKNMVIYTYIHIVGRKCVQCKVLMPFRWSRTN